MPGDKVAARLRRLAGQLEKKGGIELFARESYSFESKATPRDLASSYITFILELGKRIGLSRAEIIWGESAISQLHLRERVSRPLSK
jgi:hypothetical protein